MRVLLLVRSGLGVKQLDCVIDDSAVGVLLEDLRVVVGGIYRQFTSGKQCGLTFDSEQLDMIAQQVKDIDPKFDTCIIGDMNMDMSKISDPSY